MRVLLAVDVRALDLRLIDPDEDQVQGSFLQGRAGWLAVPPPQRQLQDGRELPGQDGALAAWANSTPGFDRPAITRQSLAGGSVSYRGRISPTGLREIHPPSVALGTMAARVAHIPWLTALPSVPSLETWTVEVERAIRLARALTGCVFDLIGATRPDHVTRPEHFLAVSHRLHNQARHELQNLTDIEELASVDALTAAANLADEASKLTEIGWGADADTCRSIGNLAAEALVAMAARFGNDVSARIAHFSLIEAKLATPVVIPRP